MGRGKGEPGAGHVRCLTHAGAAPGSPRLRTRAFQSTVLPMSADTVTGLAGVQPAPPRSDSDGPPSHDILNLTLYVWRQADASSSGAMVRYDAPGISTHMSFLEMLDVVNERLIKKGEDPIAFDHDCREGICGMCGLVINGIAHGPQAATTTCPRRMRHFQHGDTLYVEPWRAGPFPVIKDLIVDRGASDRIVEAGGFITAPTGSAAEANATLVPKEA